MDAAQHLAPIGQVALSRRGVNKLAQRVDCRSQTETRDDAILVHRLLNTSGSLFGNL